MVTFKPSYRRAKVKRMARRKTARARRSFSFKRSTRRSPPSGGNPLMGIVLPSFAYGAVRPTLKNFAQPVTAMLPLGDNSDEVVFGLAGYLLMKHSSGFLRDIGKAALYVESASLGNNIGAPAISGVTQTVASAVISPAYNY